MPAPQVRLWDLDTCECTATLQGHRKEVSALRFSASGALLASGSKDTDVVVWDVAGEAGLYRLRGHRDQVRGGGGGCRRPAAGDGAWAWLPRSWAAAGRRAACAAGTAAASRLPDFLRRLRLSPLRGPLLQLTPPHPRLSR